MITPIIDGHGEAGEETFVSIEDSARKLIDYIDFKCGGKVCLLAGLSLGAQIVVETLSQRENIADYGIIESALVLPIKRTTAVMTPFYNVSYGLIRKKWFAKLQAKELCVPPKMFERYHQDSLKMSKQSLINITKSNGNYTLKESLKKTNAKLLVIAGEKEIRIMKGSAKKLHEAIPESECQLIPKMKHGELSLLYPEEFVRQIRRFMKK